MQKSIVLIILFLLVGFHLVAQNHQMEGYVLDSKTKQPLAFVNIVANSNNFGTSSDIDGFYKLISKDSITQITMSSVGYKTEFFEISANKKKQNFYLEPKSYKLSEVVVFPGVNPAHRIIKLAINNREKNDPEKLKAYTCDIYDKFYLTVDTGNFIPQHVLNADTSEDNIRGIMDKTHFFMIENAIKKTHLLPDRDFEKVVATRVSGMKDPVFVFLLSKLQSSNFYQNSIEIAGTSYPNPISRGSLSRYSFLLEDTVYTEQKDTVFILSFRPRLNTNFKGIKGVISINSCGWAIQNVKAEPNDTTGKMSMRIQQMYEQVDSGQWFPVQLNSDLILKDIAQVKYDSLSDSAEYNPNLLGVGRSYLKNINLNPTIRKGKLGPPGIEVEANAAKKENPIWSDFRTDSLSEKEKNTYRLIDSIGKANDLEKATTILLALMEGKIKWGKFNFLLDQIIDYNVHEGVVLGVGIETNRSFSNRICINGFSAYGFGDRTTKYGGGIDYTLNHRQALKIHLSHKFDNTESGGTELPFTDKNIFSYSNYRNFLVERMDLSTISKVGLSFRIFRFGKVKLSFSQSKQKPCYNYSYKNPSFSNVNKTDFTFTEASIGFRYAYGEKFLTTTHSQVSMGTKYPIFWVNFTHGFKGVLDGQFEYNRVDFKVDKSFKSNYYGETSISILAGIIDNDIPASKLYNGNGSYYPYNLFAPNSFTTMRMNEFMADQYFATYLTHDFNDLLWKIEKGIFQPKFAIHTNLGFGKLHHPEFHNNISTNDMSLGFYESGITINNMLKIGLLRLGVGAFYRYGPYSLKSVEDNIAVKFTLRMELF